MQFISTTKEQIITTLHDASLNDIRDQISCRIVLAMTFSVLL